MVPDLIYGALEIELGIINACLPILRPLLRKFFGTNSTMASIWTKKNEVNSTDKSKTQNNTLDYNRFHRLRDDPYALDDMTAVIHADTDLERQAGGNRQGEVMVKRDVHVYTTSARQ